jgi:oxepin-CoA hydrolase/3-oxo-5,6-dehydrosuberyl-CoA semialdehyde dehydrogenase
MAVLRSYVSGRWTSPADGRPVRDAVTGEEVARVSADGIDLAAALEYGRATGGPAMRALTFHQRAALVKAAGTMLREHRSELYGFRRGPAPPWATRSSMWTRASGPARLRQQGPPRAAQRHLLRGGRGRAAGRGGQFTGQRPHSRHGVAVQVNAFNSGLGPAGEARPGADRGRARADQGHPTAYLTARLVELIIESGLLPDGSVPAGLRQRGLLDHLTEQDLLGFTGSASTARQLRAPNVVARAVRFSKADSLNCSVLGPDMPGTRFGWYVRQGSPR